jgi:hypothetical protein
MIRFARVRIPGQIDGRMAWCAFRGRMTAYRRSFLLLSIVFHVHNALLASQSV